MRRRRRHRLGSRRCAAAVAAAALGLCLGRGEIGWPMRSLAAAMESDLNRSLDLARLRALESIVPDLRGTANEVQARQLEQLRQLVSSAHAVALAYPRTPEGYEAAVIEARTLERLAHLGSGGGQESWARQAAERWRELNALGSAVPEPMREEIRYRQVRQQLARGAPAAEWLGSVEGFINTYATSPRSSGLIWEAAGRLERSGEWAQAKRLYGRAAAAAPDDLVVRRRVAGKLAKIEGVARGFPGLAFESQDGAQTSFDALRGRVAVIHFWASWSEESVALLRRCVVLWEERAPDQMALVLVCLDGEGDPVQPVGSALPRGVLQVRAGQGLAGPLPERCGVDRVPETWILDRQGRLCSVDADAEHLAAELTRLLGPVPAEPARAPAQTDLAPADARDTDTPKNVPSGP